MSDTNLNLLHFNSCNYVQDFLFTLQSLNLTPTIDKPTRVHQNSATLIDNIFTNEVEENIISGNLISDVSDHFAQFCISQSPISKEKTARLLSRDFSNFTERIYNSLIFPYLSYGLVAWGQAAKTHLKKLLRLQKRAVRLINFAPFRSHAVPYFLHSNIMPITMLYFKLSSILMFDVYNNTAPHNISHLFIPTQKIHSYSTRSSSSGNYYISHSRLNQKNDSFSIMGAKIWNSIPENLRNSSKSLFKEKVHATLLKIF